jgi:hypothetical protein
VVDLTGIEPLLPLLAKQVLSQLSCTPTLTIRSTNSDRAKGIAGPVPNVFQLFRSQTERRGAKSFVKFIVINSLICTAICRYFV